MKCSTVTDTSSAVKQMTRLSTRLARHCSPSDHFPVFTKLSINPTPLPPPTIHSFRRLHSIDTHSFLTDLTSSLLITHPPKSLGSLLISYNTTLSTLLDKHAPIITKLSRRQTKSNPWFTSTPVSYTHLTLPTILRV